MYIPPLERATKVVADEGVMCISRAVGGARSKGVLWRRSRHSVMLLQLLWLLDGLGVEGSPGRWPRAPDGHICYSEL